MFDWLTGGIRGLINAFTYVNVAAFRAALNTIGTIFSTTYLYWHTVAGHVWGGWQQLTRTLLYLRNYMQEFMFAQYLLDALVVKHDIPWLARWISWLGGKIQNDLRNQRRILEREIKAGDDRQGAYTHSIFIWVVVHVLGFLLGLARTIFKWINGIGATMWHYFTHLAAFAELLIMFLVASLERHAWEIGKLLGEFFLALVVHNMVKFAKLLEDIVNAVL